jgi:O-antigen/teichoic acid export membrane protein
MNLGNALKWSLLAELATKLVQPLVFIVLARLLTPADFGVMAAALMVIGLSQVLWDAGMGKALIQRQDPVEPAANVAFWTNMGLGVAVAAILLLVAGPVARHLFQDARIAAVLQVMSLHVLLGSAGSVHTALLQRSMAFRPLFWVRLASVAAPALASLPLAWAGLGHWALVAGSITGQAVQVLVLRRMSGWRPTWAFDLVVAREMTHFAGWVTASGLLLWSFLWLDAFIVGFYLGSHHLGLYNTASQFTGMVFAMLFAPVAPVLYSYLSRMGRDRNRIAAAAVKVIKSAVMVALPAGIVLSSVSQPLSDAVFGPRWEGIAFVIGLMALGQAMAWVVGMNGEFFRALGKPSYETMINGIALPLYLAGYVAAIQHGFHAFVWARLALTVLGVTIHLLVLRSVLKLPLGPIVGFALLVAALSGAVSYTTMQLLPDALQPGWLRAGLSALGSALVIGGVLAWMQRDFVRELLAIAKARA